MYSGWYTRRELFSSCSKRRWMWGFPLLSTSKYGILQKFSFCHFFLSASEEVNFVAFALAQKIIMEFMHICQKLWKGLPPCVQRAGGSFRPRITYMPHLKLASTVKLWNMYRMYRSFREKHWTENSLFWFAKKNTDVYFAEFCISAPNSYTFNHYKTWEIVCCFPSLAFKLRRQ